MTPTDSRRVLVTDGGNGQSRSTLAAVRALASGGFRPAVTEAPGVTSLAGASRWCESVVAAPAVDDNAYAMTVQDVVAAGGFTAVLASSDAALQALQMPGAVFVDKRELARRVAAAGLPVVPTQVFADAAELADRRAELPAVAVVKPAASGFPAAVIRTGDPLPVVPADAGELLVQPFLTESLRAVAGVLRAGRLVAVAHQQYLRTWPTPAGTASAAETVAPDVSLESRLVQVLDGYDGIFQVQLAGDHVLDLNARVYGSLPLAVAAGVNLAALACAEVVMPDVVQRARVGVRYRWLEGDLRHVWRRLRRGEMAVGQAWEALRPQAGTAHSVESLRDPLPMVVRLRTVLRSRS